MKSALTVCDKPYHTNRRKIQNKDKPEVLRNYELFHTDTADVLQR